MVVLGRRARKDKLCHVKSLSIQGSLMCYREKHRCNIENGYCWYSHAGISYGAEPPVERIPHGLGKYSRFYD